MLTCLSELAGYGWQAGWGWPRLSLLRHQPSRVFPLCTLFTDFFYLHFLTVFRLIFLSNRGVVCVW